MVKIKVFSVTKNEYDLIEDFILYHGYLVGYENIVLIDNESTDTSVLDIYEKYKKKGITVYTEGNYTGENQGILFTKYMNQYKNDCDFMIGLDTDEFLFNADAMNKGEDPTQREKLFEMFENIPSNFTSFSIGPFPTGIIDTDSPAYIDQKVMNPVRNINTFFSPPPPFEIIQKKPDLWKYLSRSNAFVKTFNGNHNLIVSHGDHLVLPIGYFHFTSTGSRRVYERAKMVVKGYNYLDVDNLFYKDQIDILNTNNYCTGIHKVYAYKGFLLRRLFIENIILFYKRLPSLDELHNLVHSNFSNTSPVIEDMIKNSNEAISNENMEIPEFSNDVIDRLLFNDSSKNCYTPTFECSFLAERLNSIQPI